MFIQRKSVQSSVFEKNKNLFKWFEYIGMVESDFLYPLSDL